MTLKYENLQRENQIFLIKVLESNKSRNKYYVKLLKSGKGKLNMVIEYLKK